MIISSRLFCIVTGCPEAQRAVWTNVLVVATQRGDDVSRISKVSEPMLLEVVVAKRAIEAFDKRMLDIARNQPQALE